MAIPRNNKKQRDPDPLAKLSALDAVDLELDGHFGRISLKTPNPPPYKELVNLVGAGKMSPRQAGKFVDDWHKGTRSGIPNTEVNLVTNSSDRSRILQRILRATGHGQTLMAKVDLGDIRPRSDMEVDLLLEALFDKWDSDAILDRMAYHLTLSFPSEKAAVLTAAARALEHISVGLPAPQWALDAKPTGKDPYALARAREEILRRTLQGQILEAQLKNPEATLKVSPGVQYSPPAGTSRVAFRGFPGGPLDRSHDRGHLTNYLAQAVSQGLMDPNSAWGLYKKWVTGESIEIPTTADKLHWSEMADLVKNALLKDDPTAMADINWTPATDLEKGVDAAVKEAVAQTTKGKAAKSAFGKVRATEEENREWLKTVSISIMRDLNIYGADILAKGQQEVTRVLAEILTQIPGLETRRTIRFEEFRRFIRWAIGHQADSEVMTSVIYNLHEAGVLQRQTINEAGNVEDIKNTPAGIWLREFGEDLPKVAMLDENGVTQMGTMADARAQMETSHIVRLKSPEKLAELYQGKSGDELMRFATQAVSSGSMTADFAAAAVSLHAVGDKMRQASMDAAREAILNRATPEAKARLEARSPKAAAGIASGVSQVAAAKEPKRATKAEIEDLLVVATRATVRTINGQSVDYEKLAKDLKRWHHARALGADMEAHEIENLGPLELSKKEKRTKQAIFESHCQTLLDHIEGQHPENGTRFPSPGKLYELTESLETERLRDLFGDDAMDSKNAPKSEAKDDAHVKTWAKAIGGDEDGETDQPALNVALGNYRGMTMEAAELEVATEILQGKLTRDMGKRILRQHARVGELLAEIKADLSPEKRNEDHDANQGKREGKRSMKQKALDTIKDDAKEIALRTGVKRTRALIATKIAEFWAKRSVTRTHGESEESFQARVNAQRGAVSSFLSSEAGQDALSYAIGFAWPMVEDQFQDPVVREYGAKIAREIRIQGGTNLLDGFLTEVIFPLAGVLTEEAKNFGNIMTGGAPATQAIEGTNIRVDTTPHDKEQDAEIQALKAQLARLEGRVPGAETDAAKTASANR